MLTDRQQEIINAAMTIIVEQGTHKLTIRNVATAIGVTEPAVYRHFASKHALLVALLENLQLSILSVFTQIPTEHQSLNESIESLLFELFHRIEANPAFALFVFTEEAFHADEQLRPILSSMLEDMVQRLSHLIEQSQERGNCRDDISAKEIAHLFLGIIRLRITQWHLRPQDPLPNQAPALAEVLSRLLSP
jgi:AcrR family transcriptional regulator